MASRSSTIPAGVDDGSSRKRKIRIVCISDTHNHGPSQGYTLPKGDILIHAGDLTNQGSIQEIRNAIKWIENADFLVKIVIAGNHDLGLDENYALKHATGWKVESNDRAACREVVQKAGITYLEHFCCTIEVDGRVMRIFGSPFTVDRGRQNWAFQYDEERADDLWQQIPDDIDILVTHQPAAGHLDESAHWIDGGCPTLAKVVKQIKPILHVCGHHHEGRGAHFVVWDNNEESESNIELWHDPGAGNKKQSLLSLNTPGSDIKRTAIVNASIMKNSFSRGQSKSFHKPIVVDLIWHDDRSD